MLKSFGTLIKWPYTAGDHSRRGTMTLAVYRPQFLFYRLGRYLKLVVLTKKSKKNAKTKYSVDGLRGPYAWHTYSIPITC